MCHWGPRSLLECYLVSGMTNPDFPYVLNVSGILNLIISMFISMLPPTVSE